MSNEDFEAALKCGLRRALEFSLIIVNSLVLVGLMANVQKLIA